MYLHMPCIHSSRVQVQWLKCLLSLTISVNNSSSLWVIQSWMSHGNGREHCFNNSLPRLLWRVLWLCFVSWTENHFVELCFTPRIVLIYCLKRSRMSGPWTRLFQVSGSWLWKVNAACTKCKLSLWRWMLMPHKGLHFWIVLWDRSHCSNTYIYRHHWCSQPIHFDQDAYNPTAQQCSRCNGYHGIYYDIITTYNVSLWNILLDHVWL